MSKSESTCWTVISAAAAGSSSDREAMNGPGAQAIMTEAAELQRQRAVQQGPDAFQRVKLLQLRFENNLSIRTIADRWGTQTRCTMLMPGPNKSVEQRCWKWAHVVKPRSDAMPSPAETGDRYQLSGEIGRGGNYA